MGGKVKVFSRLGRLGANFAEMLKVWMNLKHITYMKYCIFIANTNLLKISKKIVEVGQNRIKRYYPEKY